MENMLHMNKYMKNYIISFLSLFFMATIASALEYDEMLQVYRESKFNILSNKISLLEIEAFEGSPESAYKLGRYYQYCLASPKDKKIAGVFYYIARCFQHAPAYTKLSDILNKSFEDFKQGNEFKIFNTFSQPELDALKNRTDVLSNFILFNYYRNIREDVLAQKYKLLLKGKVSPRLLRPFEYIDKNYPIGFSSKPPIWLDEIPIYVNFAFKGDEKSALLLMVYYRYEDPDKVYQPYMRDLWIYISALLGNEDAKKLMKTYCVNSIDLFEDIIKKNIRLIDGFEKYFVLLNYSRTINDKKKEQKYLRLLQELKVDERLLRRY